MLDIMSDWGEGVISICNSSYHNLPTVLDKVVVTLFVYYSPAC